MVNEEWVRDFFRSLLQIVRSRCIFKGILVNQSPAFSQMIRKLHNKMVEHNEKVFPVMGTSSKCSSHREIQNLKLV